MIIWEVVLVVDLDIGLLGNGIGLRVNGCGEWVLDLVVDLDIGLLGNGYRFEG